MSASCGRSRLWAVVCQFSSKLVNSAVCYSRWCERKGQTYLVQIVKPVRMQVKEACGSSPLLHPLHGDAHTHVTYTCYSRVNYGWSVVLFKVSLILCVFLVWTCVPRELPFRARYVSSLAGAECYFLICCGRFPKIRYCKVTNENSPDNSSVCWLQFLHFLRADFINWKASGWQSSPDCTLSWFLGKQYEIQ